MLIDVGFKNVVALEKVVAIVTPNAAPVKRQITDAREARMLIDATNGRRTRSTVFMSSGQVILSSVQPETLTERVNSFKAGGAGN